ncbi:MAG TPA: energy-coupling factor ABC transporter substrate-binding protein [Methanobacteriaceae archaeon]|nr:energy-coupling factor ABC transporter substrate-binding protein [Methanobacteriaceae archaeon]
METKHIIMLLAAVIIVVLPFIIYPGLGEKQGFFTGADSNAGSAIEQTGYHPWFKPIWEPPSGEIESLLFALQAAIGAFILGYFLGYYKNKKKDNQET